MKLEKQADELFNKASNNFDDFTFLRFLSCVYGTMQNRITKKDIQFFIEKYEELLQELKKDLKQFKEAV